MTCQIEDCDRPVFSRDMCGMHYARVRRHGDALVVRKTRATCCREGCEGVCVAFNLCGRHYRRQKAAQARALRKCARCDGGMPKGAKNYCSAACRVAAKRAIHIRNRYGVEEEWYDGQAESGCAICGAAASVGGVTRRLVIDHDHKTGLARGTLCDACNKGIGHFKDDPGLLMAAALYLERHAREASAG